MPTPATLSVDGKPLSGNPAIMTVAVDTREHEVRATLPVYDPYVTLVRFERDLALEIMLKPTAVAEPAASPSSPAASLKAKKTPMNGKSPASNGQPPSAGKGRATDCNPPFYFENGIKVYKPGCL